MPLCFIIVCFIYRAITQIFMKYADKANNYKNVAHCHFLLLKPHEVSGNYFFEKIFLPNEI